MSDFTTDEEDGSMPPRSYSETVTCDTRPGARSFSGETGSSCCDLSTVPQLTDDQAQHLAKFTQPTPIIVIWQHEIAALIRRRSMEQMQGKRPNTKRRATGRANRDAYAQRNK